MSSYFTSKNQYLPREFKGEFYNFRCSHDIHDIIKSTDSGLNKSSKKYNSFVKREVRVAKSVILIVIMFCLAW